MQDFILVLDNLSTDLRLRRISNRFPSGFFPLSYFRVYFNKCEVEILDQMSIKTSYSDWITRQQYKSRATEQRNL